MSRIHQFVIMENNNKNLDYVKFKENQSKYDFSNLNDDYLYPILCDLYSIKTYNAAYENFLEKPEYGLSNYGLTIIPYESLDEFKNIIHRAKQYFLSEEFRIKKNLSITPVNKELFYYITYIDLNKLSEEFNKLEQLIILAISKNKFIIHYGI